MALFETGARLLSFPFNDLDENYSDLEQNIEGTAHERHVEEIWRRGDHCGKNGNEQDRISSISSQEGCFHDFEGAHQCQDQGQLKGKTEAKDEDEAEGDIFSDGDQRSEVGRLISHEEMDSVRQCDEVTEKGSQIEEKDCGKKNGKE